MTIALAVPVRRSGHYVARSRIPEISIDDAQKFLKVQGTMAWAAVDSKRDGWEAVISRISARASSLEENL
jgi:hypothetical protein